MVFGVSCVTAHASDIISEVVGVVELSLAYFCNQECFSLFFFYQIINERHPSVVE